MRINNNFTIKNEDITMNAFFQKLNELFSAKTRYIPIGGILYKDTMIGSLHQLPDDAPSAEEYFVLFDEVRAMNPRKQLTSYSDLTKEKQDYQNSIQLCGGDMRNLQTPQLADAIL